MKPAIVFIHGWGTNSGVWQQVRDSLEQQFEVMLLDMPGYGQSVNKQPTELLQETAQQLLAESPENAVWVGWSLGGMAAMQAVLLDNKQKRKIKALQILCSTPRFVCSGDWEYGMQLNVFKKFADDVANDYHAALRSFLLLQAGKLETAKKLAKQAVDAMSIYPEPTEYALNKGIEYLRDTDLCQQLKKIDIPVQIVAGKRDRLTSPCAGEYMAEKINGAEFLMMPTGHAPFLSDMQGYTGHLKDFVGSVLCQ